MTSPAVALCRACDVPLICTFAWPRFEFYCLDCGGHFDWLDPAAGNPAEHDAELQARMSEWVTHAGAALITPQSWVEGCEQCKPRREYHSAHATEAEILADQNARRWLIERLTVVR